MMEDVHDGLLLLFGQIDHTRRSVRAQITKTPPRDKHARGTEFTAAHTQLSEIIRNHWRYLLFASYEGFGCYRRLYNLCISVILRESLAENTNN